MQGDRALPVVLTIGLCSVIVGGGLGALGVWHGELPAFYLFLLVVGCVGTLIAERRVHGDACSVLSLSAIFYLFAFAAGGVYYWLAPGPRFSVLFAREDLTWALGMANAGWYLLLLGYVLNPLRLVSGAIPRLPRRPFASITGTVVFLLVVGWAARLALLGSGRYFHTVPNGEVVSTGSSWVISALSMLPTLATALIAADHYRLVSLGYPSRRAWLFRLMLTIEIVWYVPTGDRGSIVGLALMTAIVRHYSHGRRVPWKTLVVSALVLTFVVFPFGLAYRGQNSDTYQTHTLASLKHALDVTVHQDARHAFKNGAYATFSRFSDVTSLALIHARGRHVVDRAPSEMLVWAVQGFVPRALLKTKADPGLFGNEFGRAYGVNAPTNHITSIVVTQPGDFYLSFGILGVLLGMPVIGAVYRLLNDYLKARFDDPGALAVYSVIAWPLINGHESTLAVGLVGVIKIVIVFAGILVVLRRSEHLRDEWRGGDAEAFVAAGRVR